MRALVFKFFSITLIFATGLIIYSNSFLCSFHFDDQTSIIHNPHIRDLGNLKAIWDFLPRRFILYLSLALNFHFNRLDVFGYHVFNVAVHVVSAILVWWLVLLTCSTPFLKENSMARHRHLVALLTGMLFVSHPVQTEAVTYIVQRAASMAALFYLAVLCFYVKYRLCARGEGALKKFYYCCSLLAAVMAMFTKETAITLPLMVLLYEFSFLKTDKHFNWKATAPFLLTLLIIPLTMALTESINAQQARGIMAEGPTSISWLHYLLTQFRVIVTYIRLAFLPLHQNLDYDYPISQSIFELPTLFSFLFLMGTLGLALRLFSTYRLVSFSILWFFLTLVPESSIFPIKDVIFEHRLYLPLAGYCLFLVSVMYYLFTENRLNTMVKVMAVIILFYAFLTYERNKVWQNEITLFTDAIQKSPHKARLYNDRGVEYFQQGDFVHAMLDYNKAIAVDPDFADPYVNRGFLYDSRGNYTQALNDYAQALAIYPRLPQAYLNRGIIYGKGSLYTQAIAEFSKAITIDPYYAEAYVDRGYAYSRQGLYRQAIVDYDKAIRINPELTQAYKDRTMACDKIIQSPCF